MRLFHSNTLKNVVKHLRMYEKHVHNLYYVHVLNLKSVK